MSPSVARSCFTKARTRSVSVESMTSVAALSVVIAIPLQRAARNLSWTHNVLGAAVGLGTMGLGAWVAYRIGIVEGLTLG